MPHCLSTVRIEEIIDSDIRIDDHRDIKLALNELLRARKKLAEQKNVNKTITLIPDGWYWVFTADSIQKDYQGVFIDGPHWYPLLIDNQYDNEDGTFGAIQYKGELYPMNDFVGIIGEMILEPNYLPMNAFSGRN